MKNRELKGAKHEKDISDFCGGGRAVVARICRRGQKIQ